MFAPFGGLYLPYFIAFPIPNFVGITKSISQFFVSIYLISPFSLFPQWLRTNTRILSISTHGLKFIKKIKWGIKNWKWSFARNLRILISKKHLMDAVANYKESVSLDLT